MPELSADALSVAKSHDSAAGNVRCLLCKGPADPSSKGTHCRRVRHVALREEMSSSAPMHQSLFAVRDPQGIYIYVIIYVYKLDMLLYYVKYIILYYIVLY